MDLAVVEVHDEHWMSASAWQRRQSVVRSRAPGARRSELRADEERGWILPRLTHKADKPLNMWDWCSRHICLVFALLPTWDLAILRSAA